MSDTQQGPGWWQASDGRWYAPEQHPDYVPPAPPPPPPPPGVQGLPHPPSATTPPAWEQPTAVGAPVGGQLPPAEPAPWKPTGKTWALVAAGFLAFVVIGAIAMSAADEESATIDADAPTTTEAAERSTTTQRPTTTAKATTTTAKPTTTTAPPTTAPPTTPPPPPPPTAPPETVSQANARRSAESYLSFSAFSRQGLIDQLKFEGFSDADAAYGVDAQNADWNQQAAKSAASYLEISAFSRQGLIDQLIFEGFTPEQAAFGVSTTGL